LHAAADWPGYFPQAPAAVQVLLGYGADPNDDSGGERPETPLHWAASSDDMDVAAALIDGGADLETPGGSIGTPLDNAIGYGCWHVARLLVARGARVDKLWHAAALGQLTRMQQLVADNELPGDAVSQAFWHACSGRQRRAADYLLDLGPTWTGDPATPTAHPWTRPWPAAPARRTWSRGSANAAPSLPIRTSAADHSFGPP
jgi:hypothetical protein